MFLKPVLRKEPTWIKVFTGIRAEDFWLMIDQMENEFYEYELKRHNRDNRKRGIGAGQNSNNYWLSERLACWYIYV